jgi:Zn-dependent protease with chaperone function
VWRIVPTIVALQFLSFGFVKLVLTNDSILRFAGVKAVGDPAALPLFFFVFALPGIVTGMVVSYMSRVSEREADLFALEAVEDPAAATAMMRNMSIDNKAELVPSLWKRLNGSHPPVAERLAMFREWDQRRTVRP